MARRQLYDDVMDVALRATLEKNGFTRKTRRDYVREQPDRIWYFEVEMYSDMEPGIFAMAAVYLPQLDEILEKHVPGYWGQGVPSRNKAHVWTSIDRLMEIATGRELPSLNGIVGWERLAERKRLAVDFPAMNYFDAGLWQLPPRDYEPRQSDEEQRRHYEQGARELGLFVDEQWRTHALAWYSRCDDPLFVVDWIEKYENRKESVSLAILCHLAGDDSRAASYLQKCIDDAKMPYQDRYDRLYRHRRGNWLKRLWRTGWSEEKVMQTAKGQHEAVAESAEAARTVANGLGIRVR